MSIVRKGMIMSIVRKGILTGDSRPVKPKTLKVVSICSVCGEPVCTTTKDKAFRHGYKRYRKQMKKVNNSFTKFSQEDDNPCAGSGQKVVYKRVNK